MGQGATLKLPMEGLLSPRIHCGLESGSAFAVKLGKIDPNQACAAQGFCRPGTRQDFLERRTLAKKTPPSAWPVVCL